MNACPAASRSSTVIRENVRLKVVSGTYADKEPQQVGPPASYSKTRTNSVRSLRCFHCTIDLLLTLANGRSKGCFHTAALAFCPNPATADHNAALLQKKDFIE